MCLWYEVDHRPAIICANCNPGDTRCTFSGIIINIHSIRSCWESIRQRNLLRLPLFDQVSLVVRIERKFKHCRCLWWWEWEYLGLHWQIWIQSKFYGDEDHGLMGELDAVLAALKAARPLSDEAIKEINQAHASLKAHDREQDEEHWLHDNVEPAAHLLLLTRCVASQPYVKQLFDSVTAHVSTCPQCVVSYHSAKVSLYLSFDVCLYSSMLFCSTISLKHCSELCSTHLRIVSMSSWAINIMQYTLLGTPKKSMLYFSTAETDCCTSPWL